MKVYEDDVLVHDYVPCVDGDKPGFLDGETFYANSANASHFSAGGDCTYVNSSRPYVGTGANPAGRQFIDTLYYATTNTRCEIDYVLRKAPTTSTWPFSGGGSDAYYGVYIKADGTGFGEHNGTGWTTKAYAGAGATNILRTAIVDYPNNKLYVCTYGETNLSVMANAAAGKFYDVETIKIGGKYNAGGEFANIDIYGFRIYENGVLVRDFRPFWRNGFPGLMCIKTCVFVSCYPTTAAVGPTQTLRFANISELQLPNPDDSALVTVEVPYAEPYVELDKSEGQFIVFRYIPKKKTRVELDYALASSWDSGTWNLFRGVSAAAADATKHYYGAYLNASGFGFINTVSTWKSGLAAGGVTNAVGVKRTAILDNVANVGALVTEEFTNGWAACENDFDAGTTGGWYIHLGTTQYNDREFASIRIYACRVYEDGEMKRNFTPTTSADHLCACLYDYYSGQYAYVSNATGRVESPLYGGAFPAVIAEGETVKVAYRRTATLTAVAPGATSFLWKKNDVEIEGETGSTLVVEWRDEDGTDSYSVTPFYTYDGGITVQGGTAYTEVKYLKRGLLAIFK